MKCLLFAAVASLAAVSVEAAPLTFDATLKRAVETAPSLGARDADVTGAKAAALAAGQLPDPKLVIGADNFPISGPTSGRPDLESMSDVRLGLMQDVPNAAKRRAQRQRAGADIGAAVVGQTAEARAVRLSAAIAWLDLHFSEQRLKAFDEVTAAVTRLRDTATSQVASGSTRPGQSLESRKLLAQIADRRADLQAAVAKARATLTRWTDDPEAEVQGTAPGFDIDPVKLRAGLDDLPALKAFDAMGRQADADIALAKADKVPDWSWEVAYAHRDPRFGDMVMAQVTVGLPIFAAHRQDPVIAARHAAANRTRLDQAAARRELRARLESDLADHVAHHERLMRADTVLVPLAQQRADLERASYAAGTASLTDALTALIDLAEARNDRIDREAMVATDAARIVLTYGSDAP
jgi:cobalt-zinc-cadmium efflux system outer membrane protein